MIRRDPVRLKLRDLLRRNDLTPAAASPVLGYRDSEALAEMLGCDSGEFATRACPNASP